MGCNCGKPKCDGHCKASPAVLQINNPSECVLFHKVEIPASMGNEITIPPEPGLYKNVLLYYEATGNAYFYSSDGIPTPISYTDYTRLTNKPSINGVMLVGNKSLDDLGININDATLTIKQGDTALGTFSANASENVEINIPKDTGVRLRVGWTGGNEPEGWTLPNDESGVRYSYRPGTGTSGYANIIEFEIPDASFTNEETGESLTAAQVFSLLEAGNKIILDNVPLGAYRPYSGDNYMLKANTVVDDIELSAKVKDSYSEAPTPNTSYTGGAYVECVEAGINTYLGVRLTSYGGNISFCVQGRGQYYPQAA